MSEDVCVSKKALWIGWVLTMLAVLTLVMSAVMKFLQPKEVVEGFEHLGVPIEIAFGLGILELACSAIYLAPRTAVLGAILLTGYLGGAVVTHVRVSDPFTSPIIIGVLVWGGIFLREPRLKELVPIRRCRTCAVESPEAKAESATAG